MKRRFTCIWLVFVLAPFFFGCHSGVDLWNAYLQQSNDSDTETIRLFKKYDYKNRSILELRRSKDYFYFLSDSLVKKYAENDKPNQKHPYLQLTKVQVSHIDSLKKIIREWQHSIITKERINAYSTYTFLLDTQAYFLFEYFNKIDLYYENLNKDAQLSKGEDAYTPVLNSVIFSNNGRRHSLKPAEFKDFFIGNE